MSGDLYHFSFTIALSATTEQGLYKIYLNFSLPIIINHKHLTFCCSNFSTYSKLCWNLSSRLTF